MIGSTIYKMRIAAEVSWCIAKNENQMEIANWT